MNFYKEVLANIKYFDVSTRKKRRKAVELIVELLNVVHFAEEHSAMRIPRNLRGGPTYANSRNSGDILEDAIIIIRDAYWDLYD